MSIGNNSKQKLFKHLLMFVQYNICSSPSPHLSLLVPRSLFSARNLILLTRQPVKLSKHCTGWNGFRDGLVAINFCSSVAKRNENMVRTLRIQKTENHNRRSDGNSEAAYVEYLVPFWLTNTSSLFLFAESILHFVKEKRERKRFAGAR